ncbi:MAG: flagellar export chaperone FliS [Proteobacteria bacterium]|nr:flagellar export chaperone FliS [Pseudomonadota bacterium]
MYLANEYQKNNVMTANGVGIVILLYEGVINFNNISRAAIEAGDVGSRGVHINKSMAIIGELNDALDMEVGGKIALNLRDLYSYMLEELMKANLNNDPAPLDTVNTLIAELKEGWEGIKDKGSQRAVSDSIEPGTLSATL